jgi:CheY-like chemotaxis protein
MSARILIVEDEQIVAEDLRRKLGRIGHQVVGTAATGEEAVRLAGELQPDLVLMDIRLQGRMDGREAAAVIQHLTGAPVVYITAYSDVFLREPHAMRRPGLCLTKPFSFHQLKTAVEVALAAGGPPSATLQ